MKKITIRRFLYIEKSNDPQVSVHWKKSRSAGFCTQIRFIVALIHYERGHGPRFIMSEDSRALVMTLKVGGAQKIKPRGTKV